MQQHHHRSVLSCSPAAAASHRPAWAVVKKGACITSCIDTSKDFMAIISYLQQKRSAALLQLLVLFFLIIFIIAGCNTGFSSCGCLNKSSCSNIEIAAKPTIGPEQKIYHPVLLRSDDSLKRNVEKLTRSFINAAQIMIYPSWSPQTLHEQPQIMINPSWSPRTVHEQRQITTNPSWSPRTVHDQRQIMINPRSSPQLTVYEHRHAVPKEMLVLQHRKLLRAGSTATPSCSMADLSITQGLSGYSNGIPAYTVQIVNLCLNPNCQLSNIHVACEEFSSARPLDALVFQRLSYNDCFLMNGAPLRAGESVAFDYANSSEYPMYVISADVGPCTP
jgi:hypothetical protein